MIIRATNKALKMSKMIPVKMDSVLSDNLPGEWYVDLISLGRPGKFGFHFIHHPTLISILVPGRTLSTIFQSFTLHVTDLLTRHNYSSLIPLFNLDSLPHIYATNSRSMLAYLRDIKYNTEPHYLETRTVEEINFCWIEDICMKHSFGISGMPYKFTSSKVILDRYIQTLP
jgi:hypothetical protein